MKQLFFAGGLVMLLLFSCKKESFTNSKEVLLATSIDTLKFDTVFTTAGSVTQLFKIFNNNNRGIHISNIKLAGGAASPFKININGQAATQVNNMDILANDSLYIFVSVTINPTTAALPFVVRDSIAINYNGNTQWVQLEAFGQNAHFYRNKIITGHEIWNNDLPYVVLEKLTIAEGAQLTITKGSYIYIHADAPIMVNGTLRVIGEKWDSTRVVFTGDRLDEPYKNFTASWPGIFFTESSTNNSIEYAVIKNAHQGLVVQYPAATNDPKLTLHQTIIDNIYDAGILAQYSSIAAQNVLLSNCGSNIVITNGGDYRFTHCTIATYANVNIQKPGPLLQISNGDNAPNLSATFRNCILWSEGGLTKNEVVLNKTGNGLFEVTFDHILWPLESNPQNATVIKPINSPPQFDSINVNKQYYSFLLSHTSPAVDAGVITNIDVDLAGNDRPVATPDLGAYERQ